MSTQHPVEDLYALTPLQQGMLFHTVCATTPGLYVVQSCWILRGELDLPHFAAAWQQTIERHPSLRTAFEWRDLEKPVQVVYRTVELPIEHLDWRELTEAEQRTGLDRLLGEDRKRGFDLSSPPLHRLALMRLGEQSWSLLWTYHQAVLDGWSCALIQAEVAATYDALLRGDGSSREQAQPYRNYIAWLEQQDAATAERYWRARLAEFLTPTGLHPTRGQETGAALAAGRREAMLTFDRAFTEELSATLRTARLTLSTLIQAVWALVLSRRSGTNDVLFGSVVSGRPPQLHGVESMVGFFINTVPTRVQVPEDLTLEAWLHRLQTDFLEARDFEHCALVDIQGWSAVPRGHALFETVLAFENYPVEDPQRGWGGGTEVVDFLARENLNFPFALFAGLVEGELTLKALYDAEHFEPDTVQWVLEELEILIRQANNELERPVASLELLPATEQHRLVVDWNATRADFPVDRIFSELFEEQVACTPERSAVFCGADSLTYAELDARANGAALALIAAGVGRGQVVGILADRGIDFLVTILAAFKAGAAYLPLDPRAPAARLAQVWQQADLALVVHSPGYAAVCAEATATLSAEAPALVPMGDVADAPPTTDTPPLIAGPRDLAYVIFTSGSTGVPKGAMVEQQGMINHLHAKIADLGLGAGDRIAQNASQCFDISVWQFLAALLIGGETHIIPDEVALDPRALLEAVEHQGVTILETVPSQLRMLLDSERPSRTPSLKRLRWMIPTGEALPPELVAWWLGRFPHVPMLNAYGPTECSDDVTHQTITAEPLGGPTRIPIGRPIANTAMYILDERLNLLPIGVPGELFVGGIGVGRGYVNDPQKTAHTFVPDPFSTQPGARLYRTGDLACYLLDGTIDFLGRLDHQVKIRGFRIELGDIEAALGEVAVIDQCVVTARPGDRGDTQLVAYFTSQGDSPAVQELRAHLGTRLPDYMVPQHFVPLGAMPLTRNGKLDRKSLPAPDGQRLLPAEEYVPPENDVEERISLAWQQVLDLDRVGRQANFFDLGGHSLLMLRIFERLHQDHPQLALVDLFHYPTVHALARFLASDAAEEDDRPVTQRGSARRQALRRQRERRTRVKNKA